MREDETSGIEPHQIGPYRILDVLGVGGMGVVYLAEQSEPIRRRVALKIVKLGMDTKQVLARFESERQALAVMDHPNIARVLDAGVTAEGRPYFVMELVRGTPITSYADTHRLTTTERLKLFIDVCRAVQHAHQKGVIHRDLKPSNLLVSVHEGEPTVKVIDFGIAKAVGLGLTEETLVTRAGQILGTPEYMSPEQAEMSGLDVDTRTDVYSLGVILYELIVGALPFDLRSQPDYSISHTLREKEAPRPSTRLTGLGHTLPTIARYRRTTPEALKRALRGDLDWIILKAMDKDRTRRYETANGLAMDVERHLNHEPVTARPPSTRDRVAKFVRRNRPAVLAAGVATLAVLGGAAAATAGFVQAREQQQRAERSAATAERVTEFMVDLFRVSDPGEARGSTVTAREVLDRGADKVNRDLASEPAIQARLLRTIGTVYDNLGLYDDAARLIESAIAIGENLRPRDDAELAAALRRLGHIRAEQGRTAEAEAAVRRAVALSEEIGDASTLEYASTVRALATLHLRAGRYVDAEPLFRQALSIQERILGRDHADVAPSLSNLGVLYARLREPARAEPYVRRALAILEREHGPDHLAVGIELNSLGAIYQMQERYAEAEAVYNRALPIIERALGPDHLYVGILLHNLGEVRLRRGDLELAETRLARALDVKEAAVGRDARSVAVTLGTLAEVYRDQGRHAEAERLYVRALDIFDRTMDRPDADVRDTMDSYAGLLRLMGRAGEAESIERRAAAIVAADGGQDDGF